MVREMLIEEGRRLSNRVRKSEMGLEKGLEWFYGEKTEFGKTKRPMPTVPVENGSPFSLVLGKTACRFLSTVGQKGA